MPKLSVVIPTRDRPERLRECLRTLALQRSAPEQFEVLVIDDGSIPPLSESLADASLLELPVRFIRQQPGGLNAGRNRGAHEAAGEILAFLDDDILVDPGWCAAVLTAFGDPSCDAVGGRVLLRLEGTPPR